MPENQYLLIVEDDVDISEMLCDYFQAQGYEASAVVWGEDALKSAEKRRPDLVLLDIRLPDLDGFEVCRRLRSRKRTAEVPIIFLTELWERTHRITGLELGAIDYITKPFDFQELRLKVRNTLSRTQLKSPINPVTGLPVESITDAHLAELLGQKDWAALTVGLRGLHAFGNRYGFVAGDVVLRATATIMENTAREEGEENPFVGHLDQSDLVLVSHASRIDRLRGQIATRLAWAIDHLHPDKSQNPDDCPRVSLVMSVVRAASQSFQTPLEFKKIALQRQKPV